jgi:uncharacterized protein DUF1264
MKRFTYVLAFVLVAIAAALVFGHRSTQIASAMPMGSGMMTSPVSGYTLHIDASQHFAGHPDEIIHHWCKTFSPSFIECLLYDSDGPNGHAVGVETVVPTSVWKTYSSEERARWHYHRVEIPKLKVVTLPGLTKEQSQKVVASLRETYGKVWILWDPMATGNKPTGEPTITILK